MCDVSLMGVGSADSVATSVVDSNAVVACMFFLLQVLDNSWSYVVHCVRYGAVQSREQHRVCCVRARAICSLHWHDRMLVVSDWTVYAVD